MEAIVAVIFFVVLVFLHGWFGDKGASVGQRLRSGAMIVLYALVVVMVLVVLAYLGCDPGAPPGSDDWRLDL